MRAYNNLFEIEAHEIPVLSFALQFCSPIISHTTTGELKGGGGGLKF